METAIVQHALSVGGETYIFHIFQHNSTGFCNITLLAA